LVLTLNDIQESSVTKCDRAVHAQFMTDGCVCHY
jgi:hypothetical protein